MYRDLGFQFNCPAAIFEKSDAEVDQERRIAGIISAETKDRQGDTILQRGLEFDQFLQGGWYNDNHSKDTDGVVGVPEMVQQFEKGAVLPNGETAHANLTWAEGYLLKGHPRADKLWHLGQALKKSGRGRKLGFSVEGGIKRRQGPQGKTIAKAIVRNVAVTNCPVNLDTSMEILGKSLDVLEHTTWDDDAAQVEAEELIEKALTMGTTAPGFVPGQAPTSPATGEGAGQVLVQEDLEKDEKDETDKKKLVGKKKKKLNKAEAVLWLYERLPHVSTQTLGRIVDTTLQLKRSGKL